MVKDLYKYFRLLSTIEEKEEEYNSKSYTIARLEGIEAHYGKQEADDVKRLAQELTETLGYEEGSFFAVGGESFLLRCVSPSLPNRFIALKVAKSSYNAPPKGGWGAGFIFRVKPNKQKIRFIQGLQIQAAVSQKLSQDSNLAGGVPSVLELSQNPPIYAALEWIEGQRFDRFCTTASEKARIVVYWRFLKLLEKIHSLKLKDYGSIIHRDIKPHNIIVNQSYFPWLTDFSIARPLMRENLTVSGEFLGNILYSPPEQVEGREVDWRADQYSASLLIPLVFAQQRPPNEYFARGQWIQSQKNYILKPVWDVLYKASSSDPDRRFDTTGEFVRAFENACQAYKIDFRRRQILETKKTQRLPCASLKKCPYAGQIKEEIMTEITQRLDKLENLVNAQLNKTEQLEKIIQLIKELGK